MNLSTTAGAVLAALFVAAQFIAPAPARAQAQPQTQAQEKAEKGFTPQVGQAGKDVIWVPTPDGTVKGMLQLAKVTPKDFVVDLGSGDGRTVVIAARDFGARALGVEFNPNMVELSRKAAAAAGVSNRAQFRRGDIFAADFSRATVITLYLLPDLNLRLRPKILQMKPGTRVVSHSFDMGDWEADQTAEAENRRILLWIVPARVEGRWTVQAAGERNGAAQPALDVQLTQHFQKLTGTARSGNSTLEIKEGRIEAEAVSFVLTHADGTTTDYFGRLNGKTLQGVARSAGKAETKFTATRRQ
jgi:SAM-dependent methyltransferase